VFKVDKLSMREAVKHFDVSRPTLQKALKSGKISGVQDGKGQWQVDPSELARVYRARSAHSGKVDVPQVANFNTESRALPGKDDAEVSALRAELEQERIRRAAAEALAEERARHIDDLRRMLPAPGAAPQRKRWWPW
jgi:transposase